jgi:hypothetical protein
MSDMHAVWHPFGTPLRRGQVSWAVGGGLCIPHALLPAPSYSVGIPALASNVCSTAHGRWFHPSKALPKPLVGRFFRHGPSTTMIQPTTVCCVCWHWVARANRRHHRRPHAAPAAAMAMRILSSLKIM